MIQNYHDIATYVEIIDFDQLDNGLLGITVQGKYKLKIQDRWLQPDNLLWVRRRSRRILKTFQKTQDIVTCGVWSKITNHPEIKKLNLELNLKSSFSVCYILASVLPLTAQEKQTILELDETRWVRVSKKIIKKLEVNRSSLPPISVKAIRHSMG